MLGGKVMLLRAGTFQWSVICEQIKSLNNPSAAGTAPFDPPPALCCLSACLVLSLSPYDSIDS